LINSPCSYSGVYDVALIKFCLTGICGAGGHGEDDWGRVIWCAVENAPDWVESN